MRATIYESAEGLLQKMNNLQRKHLKHYKSDFEIDKNRFHEIENNHEYGHYIWVLRDSGTHIVTLEKDQRPDQNNYFNAITNNWDDLHCYAVEYSKYAGFIMKSI